MQYKGHIERGTVVLDGSVDLPDGTPVTIQTLDIFPNSDVHPDIQRLAKLLPEQFDLDDSRLKSIMDKHG